MLEGGIPRLRDMSDPRRSRELQASVESSHPSEFMPVHRQADQQGPSVGPTLLDALDLDRGRWVLLVEVSKGLLASAVVEEGRGLAQSGDG